MPQNASRDSREGGAVVKHVELLHHSRLNQERKGVFKGGHRNVPLFVYHHINVSQMSERDENPMPTTEYRPTDRPTHEDLPQVLNAAAVVGRRHAMSD